MEASGGPKQILTKYFTKIEDEIDLMKVVGSLISKNVFTYADEKEILSNQTHYEQVEAFVDVLSMKGWEGFRQCCQVFEKHHPSLLTTFLFELQG